MKKLIPLLFITLGLSAQNFVQFPDSNARWTNGYFTLNTSTQFYYYELANTVKFCLSAEDTLIDHQLYSKINYCGPISAYFGALRDTAGQVFLVPADSSKPFLIYDFNALPGDTIQDVYSLEFGNYQPALAPRFELVSTTWNPLIVQQVDTVITSRGAQRILYLGTGAAMWIEGIGNSQGLFWDPFGNISNFQIRMECMSMGDSLYYQGVDHLPYPSALAGPCDLSFSLTEAKSQEWGVYPNPSKGELNLSNFEPGELKVLSLDGQLLEVRSIPAQAQIDLNHLPRGLYILSFAQKQVRWLKM